jgi:hypothetical protein
MAMGEVKGAEGAHPGGKVNLEEERAKREQAPRSRAQTRRTPVAASASGLEGKLKEFYGVIVGGMYFVDADVAEFQAKHVDRLAATQAAWARDNDHVRKFLETLVTGGVAGAVIVEGAMVIGGSVMIVQAKRGALDPRLAPLAAFFGADLPEPVWTQPQPEPVPEPGPFNPSGPEPVPEPPASGNGDEPANPLHGPELGVEPEPPAEPVEHGTD